MQFIAISNPNPNAGAVRTSKLFPFFHQNAEAQERAPTDLASAVKRFRCNVSIAGEVTYWTERSARTSSEHTPHR